MSSSEQNKAETIANLAHQAAGASVRVSRWLPDEKGTIPVAIVRDGDGAERVEVMRDVLKTIDERADRPRVRSGMTILHDVDSLIAFVNRYGSTETIVYANPGTFEFTAIMDDHPAGEVVAGWRRHRASYACPRSPEWITWIANDGKPMRQTAFADFLEERLGDLVVSEGAAKPTEMLQVSRSLNIKTKGTIQREVDPTNGDYVMVNKQETTSDSTKIPRAFAIGIPVFEGGERYQVECRVRFTVQDGTPGFAYVMHRRLEIERDAFMGERARISTETKRLILTGTP